MRAGRAGDVDDTSWLPVFDTEVGGQLAHEAERSGVVYGEDGVPLLIRHLVDHAVPRETRVVDEDVDLAIAEVCRRFDEAFNVARVKDVTWDGDGAVGGGVVYRLGYSFALVWRILGQLDVNWGRGGW